jgi:cell wall-associated NlpC family hydrolase
MFRLGFMGISAALLMAGCGTAPTVPRPSSPPTPRAPVPRAQTPFDTLDDLFAADPDPRRNEVILVSMSQLGTPYLWGGAQPEAGFDCSGLVAYVFWQAVRMRTPRTTFEQARWAPQIASHELLRPADLVFYNTLGRPFSHVGIYIGNDRFIHAPATGYTVRIETMSLDYWRGRFNGARRAIA